MSLAVMLTAVLATVTPHEDPGRTLEDLTRRLEREGPSPGLLVRRARVARSIGQEELAREDLDRALKRDPAHPGALRESILLLHQQGDLEAGLAAIGEARRRLAPDADRATPGGRVAGVQVGLWALEALLLEDASRPLEALGSLELALRHRPHELEWLLQRSRLQLITGQRERRCADLDSAMDDPRVARRLLDAEWVDAHLDAGRPGPVLPTIETTLKRQSLRSAWWIRRGHARALAGQKQAAAADFLAAVQELSGRLDQAASDVTLVQERALALAGLGQTQAARQDLRLLIERGLAPSEVQATLRRVQLIEQAVRNASAPPDR